MQTSGACLALLNVHSTRKSIERHQRFRSAFSVARFVQRLSLWASSLAATAGLAESPLRPWHGAGATVFHTSPLPVLLRRLVELDTDERAANAGMSLAGDILMTLGFDECGRFVGQDTLGLAYQGGGSDQAHRRHSRTIKEPHMIETTESIVDVTDQFKCLKAEQRDADVLILRKLDAPIQRMDGETAEYELE